MIFSRRNRRMTSLRLGPILHFMPCFFLKSFYLSGFTVYSPVHAAPDTKMPARLNHKVGPFSDWRERGGRHFCGSFAKAPSR